MTCWESRSALLPKQGRLSLANVTDKSGHSNCLRQTNSFSTPGLHYVSAFWKLNFDGFFVRAPRGQSHVYLLIVQGKTGNFLKSSLIVTVAYLYRTGLPVIRKLGKTSCIHGSSFSFAIRGKKFFITHTEPTTVTSEHHKIPLFHFYVAQFKKCGYSLSSA